MFRDQVSLGEFRGPFGVPVEIGASIVFLPLILIDMSGSARAMSYDLIFLAIVIGSIFLHEVGHAWGALIQGVPVRRIVLYGGGGVCEQARSASRYESELIVAMGPIVNLAIWAMATLLLPLTHNPEIAWIVSAVAYVNLFLAILNLMPMMPLDGGRLFHLLLLRVLPPVAATRIAGAIGLLLAVVWLPLMVGSFVYLGLVLFFLPSLRQQVRMLKGGRA